MKDVTGQRFGMLTALEGRDGKSQPVRCDCGTTKTVNHSNLILLKTISCGCVKKLPRPAKGDVFGDLTVTGVSGHAPGFQMFTCACGAEVELRVSHVRTHVVTSCGSCDASRTGLTAFDQLFFRGKPVSEWARLHDTTPVEELRAIIKRA